MSHLRFAICHLRFRPRRPGCCAVLLILMFCGAKLGGATTNDFFAQGIKLSRAGQFPEAAAAFEKSARSRPAAGTLVNLGIAEWRRGRAGAAILAWERARWIDPFDARAGANLKFARQVAQVDEPQLKWFETASTWLPPGAWVWLAGASLWLALGLLVLPRIFRRRKAGWQQVPAALSFGVFMFSLAANFGVVSRTQIGLVVAKNAPLLLTPTRDGETVSTLAAGEPARELRTHGDYFLIRTAGASGWIARSDFRLICPR